MTVFILCGIIYYRGESTIKDISENVRKSFYEQRGRGINGFGFVEIFKDYITTRRFTEEGDTIKSLSESKACEIMFHHRMPTSTDNDVKTNHPIISKQDFFEYNYYFVHNGVIRNPYAIKREHEKLGIEYSTKNEKDSRFNDSEALMHELALVIEGKKKKEDFSVRGSIAFIMLQTNKFNKATALYYGRNSFNPLTITNVRNVLTAIKSEGGNDKIKENTLFRYDYESKDTISEPLQMEDKEATRLLRSGYGILFASDFINDIVCYREIEIPKMNSLTMRELMLMHNVNFNLLEREKLKFENSMFGWNNRSDNSINKINYISLYKNNILINDLIEYKS